MQKDNKKAKTAAAMQNQSLLSNMNPSTNLFSQFSAQYLSSKPQTDANAQHFLQSHESKQVDFFHSFDQETQRILQSLNKKNEITKLKALSELKHVLGSKDADFFELFTPTYVNIYKEYVRSENEKKVLEESNHILGIIAQRGKKTLQAKFKDLFPHWFILINDINQEVSNSALHAFTAAFPKEKWAQALLLCKESYFNNLQFYLKLTPKTILQENANISEQTAEFIYIRLQVSAIKSIATSIRWVESAAKNEEFVATLIQQKPILLDLLDANKKKPNVVAAVIDTFSALLHNRLTQPSMLQQIDVLAQKTLQRFLDDKERVVQNALWKGYVGKLISLMDYQAISKLDQSQLETKTFELLRKAGFGIGKALYDNLIVFFAYLPHPSLKRVEEAKKKDEACRQQIAFIRKFLESLIQGGLQHEETRFFCDNVVNCYYEVLYFAITKRVVPLLDDNLGDKEASKKVIKDLFFSPINEYLSKSAESQSAYSVNNLRQLPLSIGQFLQMCTTKSELNQEIFGMLTAQLKDLYSDKSKSYLANYLRLVEQLCEKVTKQSIVYAEVQDIVVAVSRRVLSKMENQDKQIQDNATILRNFEDVNSLLEIVNKKKKSELVQECHAQIVKPEHWSSLMSKILENLFDCIQVSQDSQFILKYASMIFTCQSQMHQIIDHFYQQQWNPIYSFLTARLKQENNQFVPRDQQQKFKLKWICYYIFGSPVDIQFYQNFLQIQGQVPSEWNLVEAKLKLIKNENQSEEQLDYMNLLIEKTLQIQNMSYKPYLPAIFQAQTQIKLLASKVKHVAKELITSPIDSPKFKGFLGIYEELYYLSGSLLPGFPELGGAVSDFYDVLWVIYRNQQSQKANNLLRFFKQFSERVAGESALKFMEQQLGEQSEVQPLLQVVVVLLESELGLSEKILDLVFQEKHFKDVLSNPYMWQILQCIEKTKQREFTRYVERMVSEQRREHFVFINSMIASPHSYSVMHEHKLKRFLQTVNSNVIKPIVFNLFEQGKVLGMMHDMLMQDSQIFRVALKQLIKELSIEEQELSGKDECSPQFKEIVEKLICEPLLRNQNDQKMIITLRELLRSIDLRNSAILSLVEGHLDSERLVNEFLEEGNVIKLDIATQMLQQKQDLGAMEDEERLGQVIERVFAAAEGVNENYYSMVVFDFINLVVERKTITQFAEHIKTISQHFKRVFSNNSPAPKAFYSFAIISGLNFLRKILNILEAFPSEFSDFIMFALTDSCLTFVNYCSQPSLQLIDELNAQMFIEYAETLVRVLSVDSFYIMDDHVYFELLKAPFLPVQKAAYVTLASHKQKKIHHQFDQSETNKLIHSLLTSLDLRHQELQAIKHHQDRIKLLLQDSDHEDTTDHLFDLPEIITFPLDSQKLAYLLAWLIVPDKPDAFFKTYLNNLSYIYQYLVDSGVKATFSPSQIYNQEIDLAIIQDDPSELLKLIIVSFYKFITTQLAYFKLWLNEECEKQSKGDIEYFVIQYLSKAIFIREIEVIENSQKEWRSEEFEIFLVKSIQEIRAVYNKENQKIEIVITVPNEYPLKQLKIETKGGVKLGEDKLKKWSLMMRMILQNNKDTILSALLQWKQNIDKQFEEMLGLDECAICYYVIHQTGQLPKMSCKTCKHKFHSACIQKWFQTSNKSECPLCKSQFL